ncbi:MAG: cytochrome d ubiquinol oxidase subunit II [Bacteroidales bacterium]|jgi:cytochrome d ubiquinol oxidase subunit II|nr:cytochrome d ubiquinol oxidase subunit II [Bacteroidales bacterium]
MDYTFFQHYWWFLVSLLGALLVFLLFVQGGQSLIYSLGKKETELRLLLDSLGKKWELTFTTLVTFGGAFFASFPLFYSTSFGGAYWVWILLLLTFVIQAVSFEYIFKQGNLYGQKTFKTFLFLNGLLSPILIGAAVSTFFYGAEFVVEKGNLTSGLKPIISSWTTQWHGLEAVWGSTDSFHLNNVVLGLAVFFLARCLACLYFINNIDNAEISNKSRKQLLINAIGFLITFLYYLVRLLFKDGWREDSITGIISVKSCVYWENFMQMPVVTAIFLIGVVLVLYGFIRTYFCTGFKKGIWYSGIGSVLAVLALLLIAGWNGTAYYPSLADTQSSLTLTNSSSSPVTLKAMSIVSLFIPFVLAYIWYVWRKMDKKS